MGNNTGHHFRQREVSLSDSQKGDIAHGPVGGHIKVTKVEKAEQCKKNGKECNKPREENFGKDHRGYGETLIFS